MKGLSGSGAIVTGAGSGIGRAAALVFAGYGARVAVADLDLDTAAETVAIVRASGGEALPFRCDVANEEEVSALVAGAISAFGRVKVAFNNAGTFHPSDVAELPTDAWRRVIDVNLTGVFLCLKHELAHMVEAGGGAIVNTASIWGHVGQYMQAAYVASKFGVVGLTKSAALDYATRNVRINAVAPGVIRTGMTSSIPEDIIAPLLRRQAMNRWGEPAEIAEAAAWLCSDAASLVTGTVLTVDGGYTAH